MTNPLLFPSQAEDAETLARATKKVLGNTIGSGKTRTALAAFDLLFNKDLADICIIVGPASVVYDREEGWKNESLILQPSSSVWISDEGPLKRKKFYDQSHKEAFLYQTTHIILSYNTLVIDFVKLQRFLTKNKLRYCLIGDEGHNLTNPKAKRTKCFRRLAEHAVTSWTITGSAVSNPNDLFGLDWAMSINSFGKFNDFVQACCTYEKTYLQIKRYGKTIPLQIKNITGFNKTGWEKAEEWSKRFVLRRPPDESRLPIQLPPVYRYVTLSGEEEKLYKELKERRDELLYERSLDTEKLLELFRSFRDVSRQAKVAELLDYLPVVLDSRIPIIYSPSLRTIEYLKQEIDKKGIRTGLFTGPTKDSLKGIGTDYDVLLMTSAGKEGVNGMQRANAMICFDYPFNIKQYEQIIGRIRREGQKAENVLVVHMHCKKTIDDKQKRNLETGKLDLERMRSFSHEQWAQLLG